MRQWLLASVILLAACEGPAGPAGADGTDGDDGADGQDGDTGPQGDPGTTPPAPWVVADRVDIAVSALTFENNAATVAFTLKDKDGKPLDRTGNLTEGKVTVSFVLAQLAQAADGSPAQYTAYTKRTANANANYPNPVLASAEQATTEGVEANFEVVDVTKGQYKYKFAASVAAYDAAKTQTVLAIASRTVDGVQSYDRDPFYVGNLRREEVTDASCGSCHGTFAAHGGRYTKPEHCILCHTPQTKDPETGNTVDFNVMIHKIHRGGDLPSFLANNQNPYIIAGFGAPPQGYTVHDFSEVAFPGPTTTGATNISRCTACHSPAAAQNTRWKTRPSIAACASCHDTTIFTGTPNPPTTVAHEGGMDPNLVNDGTCIVCHGESSGVSPIPAQHFLGLTSPTLGTLEIKVLQVTNTTPGSLPTVRFQVLANGQPRDIKTSPINTLRALIAGPTTDYAEYWQATVQSISGTTVTTSPNLATIDAAQGIFEFTFPAPTTAVPTPCTQSSLARTCEIPATATGSYVAAFEANWTPSTGATRITAQPGQLAFGVTDTTAVERRKIVDEALCKGCHAGLVFHGGNRRDANYCVTCHNPNNTNDERMGPRQEGRTLFVESVDFRVMIHKVHMGHNLSQPYLLGANQANEAPDLRHIRYPRPANECQACHIGTTYRLPMDRSTKYIPSLTAELTCTEVAGNDTNTFCDSPFWQLAQAPTKIAPESSVCTSCHDAPYTAAHALVNVAPGLIEACATCHGPGKSFDASKFHGMP